MGDEWDQYKVSSPPAGDEFAQYKQSATPEFAPPPGTPTIQKPQSPEMHKVNLLTGGRAFEIADNPTIQHIGEVAKGFAQPLYNVSTPGILQSLSGQKLPIPQSGPVSQIPGTAMQVVGGMALGGIEAPQTAITPRTTVIEPRGTPVVQPQSSGPSLAGIAARHIPVVGKFMRMADTIDMLKQYAAGQQPTATPPSPAPVPETAGVPWGTGGQGPVDLRGKMIPNVESPYAVNTLNIPAGKVAKPVGDPYHPSLVNPPMEPAQSGTVGLHGYDAPSRTMKVQFQNGKVYELRGVPPEIYDQYRSAESQGSFYQQQLKGRYETRYVGQVGKSAGTKAKTALNQIRGGQ